MQKFGFYGIEHRHFSFAFGYFSFVIFFRLCRCSFWDGARDGLIVSGLNHLSHRGDGDSGMSEEDWDRYQTQNDPTLHLKAISALFDLTIGSVRTAGSGIALGVKWAWGRMFAKGGKSVLTATERIGKNGKAVEVIFKDGSKMDVNAARVKEWIPNLNPNAPAGTLQKVKFDNFIPGSKGYKRFPTKGDINFLNSF